MTTIFVVSKSPLEVRYIPSNLKGSVPVIREYEVIKRTEKGYRLRVSYSHNGSMYLDEHYEFFDTYKSALEFVIAETNRVAGELESKKLDVIKLMRQVSDELYAIGRKS